MRLETSPLTVLKMNQHVLFPNTGLQFISWTWSPSFDALAASNPFFYFPIYTVIDQQGLRNFIEELHDVKLLGQDFKLKTEDWERFRDRINTARTNPNGQEAQTLLDELVEFNVEEPSKMGNLKSEMRRWSGKWIPIPLVRKSQNLEPELHPILAPRIHIKALANDTFKCTMCFNTDELPDGLEGSDLMIANNPTSILQFLDERNSVTGRLDYLELLYFRNEEERFEQPEKPFASYVSLVQALSKDHNGNIQFLNSGNNSIPVDCFIDLGNSNTAVVLHEQALGSEGFFGKSAALELQSFSDPSVTYTGSFPSKLVFEDASFASSGNLVDNNHYTWSSATRIGEEAEKLIQHHNSFDNNIPGYTYLSSPKRYLWDRTSAKKPWYLCSRDGIDNQPIPVQLPGYTKSGELLLNQAGDALKPPKGIRSNTDRSECFGLMHFSKSSLNRFFFIEILAHAQRQINSTAHRNRMGQVHTPRRLRHVVVTCPTGMLQSEQAILRRYAEEALAYITNHPNFTDNPSSTADLTPPVILPSVKDVLSKNDEMNNRVSWMYDEATCVQIVYLYGTLQHQFNRDVNGFLQGHNPSGKQKIRIGTVDLGGGTCDIMVCDHTCTSENNAVKVKPTPLFWDSWMRAGDDLRRELVEQILAPNIVEHLTTNTSIMEPANHLAQLIGNNSGQFSTSQTQFLRDFMQQVIMPLTDLYFKHANSTDGVVEKRYAEVFGQEGLSKSFLDRFNKHCTCRFEQIVWRIDPQRISEIAADFFKTHLNAISGVLGKLGCDIVLLAGGTFKIQALEHSFHKALGTLKSRVVNMNHWRPGNWHPFADGSGKLIDSKSHVALGAAIALHSGHTKHLPGFTLLCDDLKTEVKSTSRCIWRAESGKQTAVLNWPDTECSLEVQNLPITLQTSSISSPNYPAKPAFRLEIDQDNRGRRDGNNSASIQQLVNQLMSKGPFTIKLERDLNLPDSLNITEVIDGDENNIPVTRFKIVGQSLPEEEYWIEKGVHIHQAVTTS